MQIRVANRQDEPIIRTIINQANAEVGESEIELTGRDSDLTNIDSQYFWFDGIFIVAEDDGQIVGLAGARRASESASILELVRLVVVPARRKSGTAHLLMDTVLFFARNAEYKRVEYVPRKTDPADPFLGFTAHGGKWTHAVEANPMVPM